MNMFDNLITIITTTDPRFIIGWALIWFGFGVVIVALFWAREKRQITRAAEHALETIQEVLNGDLSGLGHVIDYHVRGQRALGHGDFVEIQHAHCICGEESLDYRVDDPTAERLMEQWADEHINSMMESAGV